MIIDKYKNISIKDLALADVLGISRKEVEGLSLYQQRLALQKYAFELDDKDTKISRVKAIELNKLYDQLTIILEYDYDKDLSVDYIIDFLCFVKSEENRSRCW